MPEQVYPICDKCGAQNKNVVCYEGYGVGIRLCKNICDGKYLDEMKKLNERYHSRKSSWRSTNNVVDEENIKDDDIAKISMEDSLKLEKELLRSDAELLKKTIKG